MSCIIVKNNHLYYNKKFIDSDFRGGILTTQSIDSNFGIEKGRVLWRSYPDVTDVRRVKNFVNKGISPRTTKKRETTWDDALVFLSDGCYLVTPTFVIPLETNNATMCLACNFAETEQLEAFLMAGLEPEDAIVEMFRMKGIDRMTEIVSVSIADFVKGA